MLVNGKDITVHVNGVSICYNDLGTGGTPLIFIHGFPFDKSMWKEQFEFFKEKQRVITYDIRGFGKSTSNDDEAGMALYADDLVKMLDALQIQKVIACGLSMGGYILLDAVSRYPERFEAIVLSDTQCIADSTEGKEKRYKTIEMIKAEGLNNFAEGFVKNVFCTESLEHKKDEVEKIKQVVLGTRKETVISALMALANRNERCTDLSNIDIPTLILCGEEDKLTPPAQSEFMHAHIANSKLTIIDGAAHLANIEQHEKFNVSMKEFISSLLK
ncbi:alpha/beta fold hydrolase [soil metagenome]